MIVVSLTTIHARLANVDRTLRTLLAQTRPPDNILLNVSREPYLLDTGIDEAALARGLPVLVEHPGRIEVTFVPNHGPYRKLLPALAKVTGPDDVIVTADDDISYPPYWLGRLVSHLTDDAAPAYRCRWMTWDGPDLRPYEDWSLGGPPETARDVGHHAALPTGAGGVAYRRVWFEATDGVDALRACAPRQDDIALRLLLLAKDIRVRWVPSDAAGDGYTEFPQAYETENLYMRNQKRDLLGLTANDAALRACAAHLLPRTIPGAAREIMEAAARGFPLQKAALRHARIIYWETRKRLSARRSSP